MKQVTIIVIWIAILLAVSFWIFGCATFKLDMTEPNGVHTVIETATIGKDIVIDPNGVMSTVSPKNQGIIEAIAGFCAGLLAGG